MNLLNFSDLATKMRQWRHAIHQHPETAYEEFETAKLVGSILKEYGIEIHEKIADTGIVGVIKKGNSDRVVGLRADLDALDLDEFNQFEHRSKI
ncbi:MAG: amidohydrolase, partial [Gammaproteobacteria bacterium]|nr:amidohydrolase [Gammaproteobacteria bacterium]